MRRVLAAAALVALVLGFIGAPAQHHGHSVSAGKLVGLYASSTWS